MTIYVKQIGTHWTFCDGYGICVNENGDPTYVPILLDKRPDGYPLSEAK